MSLILPKGIIVNTAGISGDIERIDREPLAIEEIAKLWKGETSSARGVMRTWLISSSLHHHQEKAP
jgi:hypothetical protein